MTKIPINHHQSHLPIVSNTAYTKELDTVQPHFKSAMVSFNHNLIFSDYWNVEVAEFKYEFNHYSKMCCPCVGVEENVNLTNAQKELLLWHWILGISMNHIQELMHVHTAKEPNVKHSLMPRVVKPKFAHTSNCPV